MFVTSTCPGLRVNQFGLVLLDILNSQLWCIPPIYISTSHWLWELWQILHPFKNRVGMQHFPFTADPRSSLGSLLSLPFSFFPLSHQRPQTWLCFRAVSLFSPLATGPASALFLLAPGPAQIIAAAICHALCAAQDCPWHAEIKPHNQDRLESRYDYSAAKWQPGARGISPLQACTLSRC